jgi:hypothetical protein
LHWSWLCLLWLVWLGLAWPAMQALGSAATHCLAANLPVLWLSSWCLSTAPSTSCRALQQGIIGPFALLRQALEPFLDANTAGATGRPRQQGVAWEHPHGGVGILRLVAPGGPPVRHAAAR